MRKKTWKRGEKIPRQRNKDKQKNHDEKRRDMQKTKGNTETHKSAEKMSDREAEERHGKRNY